MTRAGVAYDGTVQPLRVQGGGLHSPSFKLNAEERRRDFGLCSQGVEGANEW
jgi:hypothetical protein